MSITSRAITRRGITRRGIITAGALAIASSLALSACGGSGSLAGSSGSSGGSAPASSGSSGAAAATSLVVGSTPYPETQTVAYIYGGALTKAGFTITYKPNVGQRAVLYPALQKGDVNLTPEYAGSILNFVNKKATATSPAAVKSALDTALKPVGLTALELAPASDADSLNVTRAYATKHGLKSIADLAKLGSVTLAANSEFSTRPDGIKGLQSVYGLKNLKFKAISDSGGPKTIKALEANDVQVADVYSSSTSILADKLVTLTDPKSLFASQQIVPVVSTSKVSAKLTGALNAVSAALTQSDLLALNKKVFDDKVDPKTAAAAWLKSKNLG